MRRVSVGVTGVVLVAWLAGCGEQKAPPKAPPPKEIEVLSLAPGEVRDTGEYLGTIVSRQTVTLLPQVAGYVRKISVRPGQKVQPGTTLIEIDARQQTAALQSAEASEKSAEARLELAKSTFARTEALFKEGLANAQELERARADLAAAEASTHEAGAQVSQRAVQLQFHAVKAPIAGVMGDVVVRVGDYVSPTTPLTSISQADLLEVSVAVPPSRARQLTEQTPLELLDDAGKVLLTSTVFFVAPQADPRTQLVEVKGAFHNSAGLRPSELVRTRVVYSTRRALQLPAVAIVRQSGQPFAYVQAEKDGKAIVQKRPVTLGPLGDSMYVVEGGLKEGERVAVTGLQMLRDGAPVNVKGVQTAAAGDAGPGSTRAQ